MSNNNLSYGVLYAENEYEYRLVTVNDVARHKLPNPMRLLSVSEWKELGVDLSHKWSNFEIHPRKPHVLQFRRLRRKNLL